MKPEDILTLIRAGYTRQEIEALGQKDENSPDDAKPTEEVKEPAEAPETPPEATKEEKTDSKQLEQISKQLDALTKALQASNLQTSTLPEVKVDNIEDILQKLV